MNLGKISVRYARALYSLAEEKNLQHEVYKEICILGHSFIQLPKLTGALANPMYSFEEKQMLLTTAAGGEISPLLTDFIKFVITKGREEFMIFISMSYQDIYRKEQHIVLGKITAAYRIDDTVLNRIRKYISDHYDSTIQLTTHVDTSVIGGFVLEVNNYKLDVSARTELKKIQATLNN